MEKATSSDKNKIHIPSVGRFHFWEMFNNVVNGKTSITKFCGFLLIVTACGGFAYGSYKDGANQEIFMTASAFAGLGTTLLMGKVLTKDAPLPKVEDVKETVEGVINQEKL